MATRNAEVPVHVLLAGACQWFIDDGDRLDERERRQRQARDWEVERKAAGYEGPERRRPDHQHRRNEDADIRINTKKLGSFIALILGVITLVGAVASYGGSKLATQQEIDDLTDSLRVAKRELREWRRETSAADSVSAAQRSMILPIAKAQCLEIADRGEGRRGASLVGLPCDQLLPGVFDARVQRARER